MNLKLIWDVVSQIKVGERGACLCRRRPGPTDRSSRYQSRPAQHGHLEARAGAGRARCTRRPIRRSSRFRWATICRAARCSPPMPRSRRSAGSSSSSCRVAEAYAPLYGSIDRSILLARSLRLVLACLAGLFLARRMVGPIQALQPAPRASAAATLRSASRSRPATSSRRSPTSSTTWPAGWRNPTPTWNKGREPHARAGAIGRGAARAWARSARPSTRRSILRRVLATIVAKAVQLSDTEAGAIYVFDEEHRASSACAPPTAWATS